MLYQFEWDPAKADSNLRKHGVSFDEATTVFDDPKAIDLSDREHSTDELRYLLLGMSNQQRVLVIAYTERPPLRRLISARPANRQERGTYGAEKG